MLNYSNWFTNNYKKKEFKINYDTLLESSCITIKNLEDFNNPKYSITKLDIFKYITVLEYLFKNNELNLAYNLNPYLINKINNSNNLFVYNEILGTNKYNNILIDLYHQTIPSEIIDIYPIGIVFNLKLYKNNFIQDLTKTDLNKYKNKYKYFLFVQEKLKFQIKFPTCLGKLNFKLIKINYLKVQKLCRYSYMFVKINKNLKLK